MSAVLMARGVDVLIGTSFRLVVVNLCSSEPPRRIKSDWKADCKGTTGSRSASERSECERVRTWQSALLPAAGGELCVENKAARWAELRERPGENQARYNREAVVINTTAQCPARVCA